MKSNNISFSTEKYLMFTTCFSKSKSSRDILIDLLEKEKINTQLLTDVNQIHSDKVLVVNRPGNHGDADGLIKSGDQNLILFIKTADCVPIFIYDDVNNNYGIVHAGWRGAKKKIHLKAIDNFIDLGSDLNNLNFIMGTYIKPCCYEVGKEMVDDFKGSIIEKNNSYYLDLNKSIKVDLVKKGVESNKIKIDNSCTFGDSTLHSYRRDKESSGRMLSCIVVK